VVVFGELPQPPMARRRPHTLVARMVFFIVIFWNEYRVSADERGLGTFPQRAPLE
jgi:hypothetical protein